MLLRKWWNPGPARQALESAARDLNRRAAEFLAERARALCPVDTGFLRDSITVVSSMNGAVWHVIATAPYAVFVELGSLHGGTWVPPNPFMRRALNETIAAFPHLAKQTRFRTPFGDSGAGHLGVTIGGTA